ncbi:hypothetical protein Xen7305DRAFT_00040180 [Xenococcus sp. PCC 7305]|uniref:hypothetical protein n=1 Tax=Xenococcus sp. PCC 7305 TaxID=102125 RepID=UPI0002ACEF45|nr:hypothetical protein [Xenococcus sp. PCC 7305]ELS04289.1 hypothetical protein Xen7305DRAFT_00040180 [Xenococcus sp. PCC 7305]
MSEETNNGLSKIDPRIDRRLKELKRKVQEDWRIDEILNYIDEYRNKYRDAIWSWNEKQVHFLYLALSGESSCSARKEISDYYIMSATDVRSLLSKGLFMAVRDISDFREKDIGGKIYKKNITWNMVQELFKKLGYYNENKKIILDASLLREINNFLDTKEDIYEDEIELIKKLIHKNFCEDNNI